MTARTLVQKTLEIGELARQLSGLKTFVTQAWRPEFHPQSLYKGGRREQTLQFSSDTRMQATPCALPPTHTYIHTHAHIHNPKFFF